MIDKNKILKTEEKSLYSNALDKSSVNRKKFSFFGFAANLTEKSSKCESLSLATFQVLTGNEQALTSFSNGRTQVENPGRENRCLPHHGTARTINGVRVNPWVGKENNGLRVNQINQKEPLAMLKDLTN